MQCAVFVFYAPYCYAVCGAQVEKPLVKSAFCSKADIAAKPAYDKYEYQISKLLFVSL